MAYINRGSTRFESVLSGEFIAEKPDSGSLNGLELTSGHPSVETKAVPDFENPLCIKASKNGSLIALFGNSKSQSPGWSLNLTSDRQHLELHSSEKTTPVLFFHQDGRVGLGTNTPKGKLDVAGTLFAENIRSKDSIQANDLKVKGTAFIERLVLGNSDAFPQPEKLKAELLQELKIYIDVSIEALREELKANNTQNGQSVDQRGPSVEAFKTPLNHPLDELTSEEGLSENEIIEASKSNHNFEILSVANSLPLQGFELHPQIRSSEPLPAEVKRPFAPAAEHNFIESGNLSSHNFIAETQEKKEVETGLEIVQVSHQSSMLLDRSQEVTAKLMEAQPVQETSQTSTREKFIEKPVTSNGQNEIVREEMSSPITWPEIRGHSDPIGVPEEDTSIPVATQAEGDAPAPTSIPQKHEAVLLESNFLEKGLELEELLDSGQGLHFLSLEREEVSTHSREVVEELEKEEITKFTPDQLPPLSFPEPALNDYGTEPIRGKIKADRQWHDAIPNLKGFQAFQILAWVWERGNYAISNAIAVNINGDPSSGAITSTQSYMGSSQSKIEFRWAANRDGTYKLQARSRLKFAPGTKISYKYSDILNEDPFENR